MKRDGVASAAPVRDRDAVRQRILAAAQDVFVAHGYEGASMQAIADGAGLPKANVHYYFGSKARLYRELLDGTLARWNRFLADVTPEDDPAEVLARFIREKVRLAYEEPAASKLFALEVIQGAPRLRGFLDGEVRTWLKEKSRIIEAWIAAGRMDPVDPALLIFMIWSTTQHYADFDTQVLTLLNRREYEPEMMDEVADFLVGVILKGIGIRPGPDGANVADHKMGRGNGSGS